MNDQKKRYITYALAALLGLVAVGVKWFNPDMEWAAVVAQIGVFVGLSGNLLAMVKSNPAKYDVTPVEDAKSL